MRRRDVLQILPAAAGGARARRGRARLRGASPPPARRPLLVARGALRHVRPLGPGQPPRDRDRLVARQGGAGRGVRHASTGASTRRSSTRGRGLGSRRTRAWATSSSPPSTTTASACGRARLTDYDIAATPFRRDVVRELSDACRAEGIVFCAYHSICDWRHPDYPLGSPGGEHPEARPGHGPLHGLPEGPARGAAVVLRPARGPLVRRRVGGALDGGARYGPLPLLPVAAAVAHRQQPRGEGPAGHGGHHRRRGLRRGLRHARAAGGPLPGRTGRGSPASRSAGSGRGSPTTR